MTTIVSPNPPLNIFDRVRFNADDTWQTLYEVPEYEIPASGPNPTRIVEAVALLTSMLVTNDGASTVNVSLRAATGQEGVDLVTHTIINGLPVPPGDFALLELGKQNFPSGDRIEIKMDAGQTGVAHLSYVLNQREQFEVITP